MCTIRAHRGLDVGLVLALLAYCQICIYELFFHKYMRAISYHYLTIQKPSAIVIDIINLHGRSWLAPSMINI